MTPKLKKVDMEVVTVVVMVDTVVDMVEK